MTTENLTTSTNLNTEFFSLNGYSGYVRVLDVYDGDTIICAIPLLDKTSKFHVRLSGIDTCEIKSKLKAAKEIAVKARERILHLITHQTGLNNLSRHDLRSFFDTNIHIIYADCEEFDKYGRVLVHSDK
jgi:hypothetical protein